jgi:hypothetical protein
MERPFIVCRPVIIELFVGDLHARRHLLVVAVREELALELEKANFGCILVADAIREERTKSDREREIASFTVGLADS